MRILAKMFAWTWLFAVILTTIAIGTPLLLLFLTGITFLRITAWAIATAVGRDVFEYPHDKNIPPTDGSLTNLPRNKPPFFPLKQSLN